MEETKVKIKGYEELDADDEIALLQAVAEYPIAAAIYVDKDFFKVESEIYVPKKIPSREEVRRQAKWRKELKDERKMLKLKGEPLPPPPDDPGSGFHAVIVIDFDYDPVENKRFWWIKNSSGEGWGMNGYGRVIRRSSLEDEDEGSSIVRTVRPLFF